MRDDLPGPASVGITLCVTPGVAQNTDAFKIVNLEMERTADARASNTKAGLALSSRRISGVRRNGRCVSRHRSSAGPASGAKVSATFFRCRPEATPRARSSSRVVAGPFDSPGFFAADVLPNDTFAPKLLSWQRDRKCHPAKETSGLD